MALRRRITQKDVAARAGVSQAIVSQVLNERTGNIRLNQQTRQRVLEAMRELGYAPNLAAQSLAGGLSRLLGVFTFESVFPTDQRDFYYPFLEGIEEEAVRRDFDLLLHTRTVDQGRRSVVRGGVNRLLIADGTLFLGYLDAEHRRELAEVVAQGHPCVFIGRRELPGASLSYVTADYTQATRQLVEQLLALGHRQQAYLAQENDQESSVDRRSGYLAFDLPPIHAMARGAYTPEVLRQLIDDGVTALVLENDHFARKTLEYARQLGLQLPQDLSFVVLGDPLEPSEGPVPEWTSFVIPRKDMGRAAVSLLADQLQGQAPAHQQIWLPCQLRQGNSVAPRSG
jgi:DNA-binding LacI/PurR family transcriptional regulator